MRTWVPLLLLAFVALGCEEPLPGSIPLSKEPISVRGWIADVEGATKSPIPQVEAARRLELFQQVYVEVANAPYVSGGIGENGSFLLLDVPPGNATITFMAPGAPAARLVLQNVPGNADVLIPALLLKPSGVALLDPGAVVVRLAGKDREHRKTGLLVSVAGTKVPVIEVPLGELADRRDHPNPPAAVSGVVPVFK